MVKRILLGSLLILGIQGICFAQNYKWIKQIGDKAPDQTPVCKLLPNGESIVGWFFTDSTSIKTVA